MNSLTKESLQYHYMTQRRDWLLDKLGNMPVPAIPSSHPYVKELTELNIQIKHHNINLERFYIQPGDL